MTQEQIAEQEAATAAAKKEEEAEAGKDGKTSNPHSDPVKEALDVERKKKRPEIERAAHSLKMTAERLRELGGNPAEIIGHDATSHNAEEEGDDDKPVTRGDLKRMERERVQRTALQLAENITNPDERELAKEYLRTRIQPSGNAEADLADAMALVNSVKNRQVSEEIARKAGLPAKRHISGTGNPPAENKEFEVTDEEKAAARISRVKPENLKQWVLDRREGKPVIFGTAAKKMREAEAKNR
jgi:hypothetical protein